MKNSILILILFIMVSCKKDDNSIIKIDEEKTNTESIKKEEKKESGNLLPKFATIQEMLKDSGDYYEENNSLKFISKEPNDIHVQVSKPIFKGDLEKVIIEIVKRDIIYVAFQTFALTDINELTITSVPTQYENKNLYVEKYKMTIKIDREKAKEILNKYLASDDFSILFDEKDNIWLPNDNFSILKFKKLNDVFDDMSEK